MWVVLIEIRKNRYGRGWNPRFHFEHDKLDKAIRQSTRDIKMAVGDNIKFTGRE